MIGLSGGYCCVSAGCMDGRDDGTNLVEVVVSSEPPLRISRSHHLAAAVN